MKFATNYSVDERAREDPRYVAHMRDRALQELGRQVVAELVKNPATPCVMQITNDHRRDFADASDPSRFAPPRTLYEWQLDVQPVRMMDMNFARPGRVSVDDLREWAMPLKKIHASVLIEELKGRAKRFLPSAWRKFCKRSERYFADEWLARCARSGR